MKSKVPSDEYYHYGDNVIIDTTYNNKSGYKEEKTPQVKDLEEIAKKLVLSKEERPTWDIKALKECGYKFIKVEENIGKYVWDEKQKVEQKSRPLFMIVAK